MWARGAVLAFMCVTLSGLALEAGGQKDVKKDAVQKDVAKDKKDGVKDAKDAKKDDKKEVGKDKKFEVPKDAIAGVVKSVDVAKASFTITAKDKKERTFLVDKKTEFWGPKGGDRGTGPAGLKDDCMAAGYEIRVTASADGKTATNVYLPNRKGDTKDKDKK